MNSITNQLRYGITIVVVVSLCIMGSVLIYTNIQTQLTQLQVLQQIRAQDAANRISAYLADIQLKLNYLAQVRGLADLPPETERLFLEGLVRHNEAYERLTIFDQTGQIEADFAITDKLPPDKAAYQTLFAQVMATQQEQVGVVEIDPKTRLPFVLLAVPLRNAADEVGGVLVGEVNLRFLWPIMANLRIGETGYGYVIDQRQFILVEKDVPPAGTSLVSLAERPFMAYLQEGSPNTLKTYPGLRGQEVLGLMSPIPKVNWFVVIELPTVEVYAPIYNQIVGMLVLSGLITFITVLMGIIFSRRIMLPLQRLNLAARQIRAGEFGARVPVESDNELGVTARTFNQMAAQIEELYTTLEQKVVTRTQRLEMVATLSERLAAILDLDTLLAELVQQVKEKFGYYHVHIYLLDAERENLVVAEGTGEAGLEMKRKRHHISIHQRVSLVARAAHTEQVVRVDNVRQAVDWLPNPLLPETYAEMAVPIMLEGQVMGVLDVQQNKVGGLDDTDESLLRSLASHVAIALNNAQLFNETQQALHEMQAYQERYVQQMWDREKIIRRNRGWSQFSVGESTTLQDDIITQVRQQVTQRKQPLLLSMNQSGVEAEAVWAAPIQLGQSVIGSLQLYGVEADQQWTAGELALITAVIDQVAQSAESLRLVEEVQEQAGRQRLISQIGDKLRSAPDMDTLMEITLSELTRLLKPARTFVHLDNKE